MRTDDSVSCELLDAMTDALVAAPDAVARSAVIATLVEEIYATVEWVDPGDREELASLHGLIDAAHEHQKRVHEGTGAAPGRDSSAGPRLRVVR